MYKETEKESVKEKYERVVVELIDFTGEKSIFECVASTGYIEYAD